jgi:hypothetical protein
MCSTSPVPLPEFTVKFGYAFESFEFPKAKCLAELCESMHPSTETYGIRGRWVLIEVIDSLLERMGVLASA